jgi:hypothetical protein
MQTLRAILRWYLGLVALFNGVLSVGMAWAMLNPKYIDQIDVRDTLVAISLPLIFAIVFGVTWWSIRKGWRSSRALGIVSSVILLVVGLYAVFSNTLRHDLSNWLAQVLFGSPAVAGLAGIVAFSRRRPQPTEAVTPKTLAPIAGDGTSRLLEKIFPTLVALLFMVFFHFWLLWCAQNSVPGYHNSFLWNLASVLLLVYMAVFLHETGHALAAIYIGMKVRDFVMYPICWGHEDGRPRFRLNLKADRAGQAWVGAAQATPELPLGRLAIFTMGGVAMNLATGILAFIVAKLAGPSSPLQAGGLLALYGGVSCVIGMGALVPRRYRARQGVRGMYSDGAQLYQLLSGGPWGDYHRAVLQSSSSLVTALRPRDFDVTLIERAAAAIAIGREGLQLQLMRHYYDLDRGEIDEAAKALQEASTIYDKSASDICPEPHTDLIFGAAMVLHDAVAAREWWERMEAKKPTRFNVDYWRAKSALAWIEGDLNGANEAWKKSNLEAQKLPHAGAYDFDRYLCALLRNAIDASVPQAAELAIA